MKLQIEAKDILKMEKKMKSMVGIVKRTGIKRPRLAAEYMVLKARSLAPHNKGYLRKIINAFKRGRNSYEVLSHRFPRANESKNRRFPVHAWIEGIVKQGGWGNRPYTGKGLEYFGRAVRMTRYRFIKGIRKDIQRGLRIKF